MSRRTKQLAASRRVWRAEHPPQRAATAEFGFAESRRVVSNPVFYCGNGGPSQHKPMQGERLRCAYAPGSLGALVHDPATAAGSSGGGIGNGKPLPLPPCRAAHHRGGARVGPALVVGGPHGRLLRRRAHHRQDDPFLAAYVACTGTGSGGEKAKVHREEKTQRRIEGEKKGVDIVQQGCGVSWAASVKYAGAAMSCRNVCDVDVLAARDAPVAAAKEERKAETPEGPTLDLSWAPVVLSARAMERRREQR